MATVLYEPWGIRSSLVWTRPCPYSPWRMNRWSVLFFSHNDFFFAISLYSLFTFMYNHSFDFNQSAISSSCPSVKMSGAIFCRFFGRSCVGDGDEWRLGHSSLWDGGAGPRTDSSSDDGSSTVASFTTCFLTVAGGFLVLDNVTFWRFFCRCYVGDGDGDLRSGEDFLRGWLTNRFEGAI